LGENSGRSANWFASISQQSTSPESLSKIRLSKPFSVDAKIFMKGEWGMGNW